MSFFTAKLAKLTKKPILTLRTWRSSRFKWVCPPSTFLSKKQLAGEGTYRILLCNDLHLLLRNSLLQQFREEILHQGCVAAIATLRQSLRAARIVPTGIM